MATKTKTSDYAITASTPTGVEYLYLRKTSGLTAPPVSYEVAEKALAAAVHCLVARTEAGEAIGMVRLIGDGHVFLGIYDMCVVPEWQGRGIGGKLLDQMLQWVDGNAPDAYVNLIGDPPGEPMYRKRGFRETSGKGMVRSKWGM